MNYKLRNGFGITGVVMFLFSTGSVLAQDSIAGPRVIAKWEIYEKQVRKDSTLKMIELQRLIPGLVYDLRYATTNNFMKRRMYPEGTRNTYLRWPAARALLSVQAELHGNGMALKIFDAYRPYSVTVKFWELVRDERYVANPAKGSGHNRGIAVDLTIIYLATGKELDMGTDFDNFTDTAHHSYTQLPEEVLQNRLLLRKLMEKHGFKAFESEWWHYFIPDAGRYDLLDIDFKKLKKVH